MRRLSTRRSRTEGANAFELVKIQANILEIFIYLVTQDDIECTTRFESQDLRHDTCEQGDLSDEDSTMFD